MRNFSLKFIFLALLTLFFSACGVTTYKTSYHSKQTNTYSKFANIQEQWRKTPYILGGTSKKGADCSGFTQNVLKVHFGTQIPRNTVLQMKSGKKISKSNLRSGDLVFFKTGRGPNGLHVGIYTKKNTFIHLSPRGGVREAKLDNVYWKPKYIGARRYIQ